MDGGAGPTERERERERAHAHANRNSAELGETEREMASTRRKEGVQTARQPWLGADVGNRAERSAKPWVACVPD
jgi:hypothetical protein